MGIIAKPLGWLMTWLYSIIGNYALVIILLTVAIKIILYPVYKNQILSTANMTEIQPKVQEIQRKYAKDKETMNQKLAELYQEENYNPAKGCMPMIVQMIVIMALFTVLRNPMTYMSNEAMYFAIHESFLWIKDLSQPDLWILPILAGVTTFLSQYLSTVTNPNSNNSTNMMMKSMMYFFPIMIVWLARSYPSGLALYWFVGQFVQIFFNLRLNKVRKALKNKNKKGKK